jgi:hypothetical protein
MFGKAVCAAPWGQFSSVLRSTCQNSRSTKRIAAENADGNAEFAAFEIDLFHDTILALERTVGDLHHLAHAVADLRFDTVFSATHLRKQRVHFTLAHRNRLRRTTVALLGTGKADHARGVP